MLAFTHPGKIGDLLYALPTVKKVCETRGQQGDFYTSDYCYSIVKRLIERQSYINKVYISGGYVIQRMDIGVQPWKMPVDTSIYDTTYHLGFRSVPSCSIPEFIANSIGVSWNGTIEYEYDDLETLDEPYIVLAPRGLTSYATLFREVASISPVKVVEIGGEFDFIQAGINKCGLDLLDTLPWIAKSKGFLGLMSSQLVLANGFNIPRVAPHDGMHWDMRHVVNSSLNHYPVNPSAKRILELLGV